MKKILILLTAVLISSFSFADTLNVSVKNVTGLEGTLTSGLTQYRYITDNSGNAYIETYNNTTQNWDKSINIPAYLSSTLVFWGLAKDKNGQTVQNKSILAIQGVEKIYVLGVDFTKKTTTQLAEIPFALLAAEYEEPTATMGNGCLTFIMANPQSNLNGWSVDIEPFLTDSTKTDDSPKDTIAKIPDSEV